MKRVVTSSLVAITLASMTLAGCTSTAPTASNQNAKTETTTAQTTPAKITEFKQSPFLENKNLPSIKDRLPEQPKITNDLPTDFLQYQIGTYGGTLRTVTSVVDWDADVFVMNDEALINTPGILGKEITGNIVQGFEASSDQKTFTFHLRKGLKWSDGQPVTMDDFKFAIDDVLNNKDLTPVFPSWLRAGGKTDGEPMKFDVIDDWTFTLSFAKPYGGFPVRLAIQGWRGYTDLLKPAHFLKQFHKKYAKADELEAKIKEAGFDKGDWVKLFTAKDVANWDLTKPKAIGFPVLYPWMLVKANKTSYEYERNPYYFKIDAAGNQLPYIDKIQSTLVQDMEMVGMKTIAGEVDFSRESAALVKMPLYKENEKNGYKALLSNMHVTPTDIFLNMTNKDPVWRKVVQDIRFRKALNLAMNRKEIIDSIYYGFAEPGKIEDSTFDLDQANKLLDDMGMKKGSDGFRVGPDGKKFTIPFEVATIAPDIVPMAQLIAAQWQKLGLDVTVKTLDSTLWGTRNKANELKATFTWVHTPLWYMGDWGQGNWAPLWQSWYASGGKEGEEPPADVKKFYEMIDQVNVSSPEEAQKAIEKVKDELGKNLYFFVPIENVKQPLIVNSKIGNVSDKGFAIGMDFAGEQFFFKK